MLNKMYCILVKCDIIIMKSISKRSNILFFKRVSGWCKLIKEIYERYLDINRIGKPVKEIKTKIGWYREFAPIMVFFM